MNVPPVRPGNATKSEELASHVKFLAQPELKGRKPGTRGSRIARRYIESRFEAYGLVPWAQARGYELSFGRGRNVVGVLPGSDPNLAGQIVLLCAHYDHLGKDEKGRICPGAADNASGVAVLLETAKQMSLLEPRPKRSVAFAAFDCEEEMLFGSLAFSCRKDVEEAKIAAIINLDILGRDFLDVVRNTVFVAGTEPYPAIREQVCRFGTNAGIRVLPIGTDLVGPRGDHVTFESRDVPCLFFSSGIYRDYHKPTDTADKLNYTGIARSADVVLETVKELANGEDTKRTATAGDCDLEELRTVTTVISEVDKSHAEAGIKKEDVEAFKKLEVEAENLLKSGRYDRRTREKLIVEATGTLVPYMLPIEDLEKGRTVEQQKEFRLAMQCLQDFYINYRREIMEGCRKLVAHVLKYRPGPFRGMPKFEYEIYDIADDDISMTNAGGGRYALDVLINHLTIKAEVKSSKWLLKSFGIEIAGTFEGMDCEGTREQIADYCLLRLRGQRENESRSARTKKVLRAVTGMEPKGNYRELLKERLESGGVKDETEWIVSCISSGNPDLAQEGIEAAKENKDGRIRNVACRVILDRNMRADVRGSGIELAIKNKDKNVLLAMCDVVDDTSPAWKTDYIALFRKGYPFSERIAVQTILPFLEKELKNSSRASKTIGDLAREQLKKVTKRDYGKDAQRWRKWVEVHVN